MKALLSFFSGLPISWYIIAILAGSLSLSIYVLQGKIEEIGGYKVAQESYVSALNSAKDSLQKKGESCKIDDKSVVELTAEKEEVRNKIDNLVEKITKLKSGTANSATPTLQAPQNAKESNVLYGPELLSLDLRLLLDQAYCVASPADTSVCGTTRQSSDIPLQSKPSR